MRLLFRPESFALKIKRPRSNLPRGLLFFNRNYGFIGGTACCELLLGIVGVMPTGPG